MSAADRRDTARARAELVIHKQLSAVWSKGIEAAMQADMGCMSDADGLASYQRDRDRAISAAARLILGRADAWVDFAEQAATVAVAERARRAS